MLGGAKPPISGQRRRSGGGVIGEGQPAPSPPTVAGGVLYAPLAGSRAEPLPLKGFLAF